MAVRILHSIFYGTVLQNSAVGAIFVLFILLFRKMTEQLSKGFVRMLWILLLVSCLRRRCCMVRCILCGIWL